jgi:fatty-acyl-CoA synthase
MANSLNDTIWQQWLSHAEEQPAHEAIIHFEAGEMPVRWPWGTLIATAKHVAAHLTAAGVKRGEVCALIIRHHRFFYPVYMGVCAMGAIPAVLAYPNNRLHPDKFRDGIEGMSKKSGLSWILTERALEPTILPLLNRPGATIHGFLFPLEWEDMEPTTPYAPPPSDPGAICLLQHSSGTTGLQKAVALSHRAVLDQIRSYADAIALREGDRIVSWLPLYHDMGLIAAFYLALSTRVPLVQLNPFEWIGAPVLLLEAIAQEHGTLTWLPNFAYNHMVNRIDDRDMENLRLDSVRMFINCSEMVRPESHERFWARFSRYGVRRESLAACYAMAETTFAVTQTGPNEGTNVLWVDREELTRGRIRVSNSEAGARKCASSGRVISGVEVRIVGSDGLDLSEDKVGEIAVRSVSLFDGYRNDPAKSIEVLRDGWYYSGDFGFLHGGEYYIVGRQKDLIIVAGKNIYPEDVEDIVSQVQGISPGRVVAFGIEDGAIGTEQVAVVAETPSEEGIDAKRLRLEIKQAVMQIDVTVARVYLAPPRWLIKSSAGKPSRKANRERALTELTWE